MLRLEYSINRKSMADVTLVKLKLLYEEKKTEEVILFVSDLVKKVIETSGQGKIYSALGYYLSVQKLYRY